MSYSSTDEAMKDELEKAVRLYRMLNNIRKIIKIERMQIIKVFIFPFNTLFILLLLPACEMSSIVDNNPPYVKPTPTPLPDGSDVTSWSNTTAGTEVSATIPDGTYANKKIVFQDLDLLPSNILQGVNIFGVIGTFLPVGAAPACVDNVQNTSACTTSSNRYVTATLGANLNGAAGSLTATIPAGYYDGSKSATMSDADLVNTNIKTGVNLFGVNGSLTPAYAACTDNANNILQCSTGANRYVADNVCTASLQTVSGCFASTNSWVSSTQYNGRDSSCTANNGGTCWISQANKDALDVNLAAGNIKSGVTIFGILGTATLAYSACTDNANNVGQCSTTAGRYVSPTLGTNISGANGSLSATITTGFYDGTKTATMSDTNLTVGNIKSGVTIFGVLGTAPPPYAACADDTAAGSPNAAACSTAASRYVTPTACTLAAQTTGTGCYAPVNSWISGNQYNGRESNCTANNSGTCWITQANKDALDANLAIANIKSGVTIFGITGNYVGSFSTATSNAHRDLATSPITQSQEVTTYAGADLPAGYRDVPLISKDDDGYTGGSVTFVNRTGWGATTCGTSGTIVARIADCAANGTIGPNATWDGATKGNAGMGSWKLVARTGNCTSLAPGVGCKEVWQDQRTGLLWSSLVNNAAALNWCKASGSNNSTAVTTGPKENDANNYCNNATYQNTGTAPISACFEHTEFATTYNNDPGKAGLNKASTPSVRWRLPTIYDYNVANANGVRFVLPDMGTDSSGYEWSASVVSSIGTMLGYSVPAMAM